MKSRRTSLVVAAAAFVASVAGAVCDIYYEWPVPVASESPGQPYIHRHAAGLRHGHFFYSQDDILAYDGLRPDWAAGLHWPEIRGPFGSGEGMDFRIAGAAPWFVFSMAVLPVLSFHWWKGARLVPHRAVRTQSPS